MSAGTPPHNIIALLYDFDGTLTPQPMQEYTILPELGINDGQIFWNEVKDELIKTGGEDIATYMRMMIEKSQAKHFPVKPNVLMGLANRIKYFPGVETFFERINTHVKEKFKDIEIRHYIISAGLKEIIMGTNIAGYFFKVFASQYHYDEYDRADFPNIIVNDTLKTQFIFRINKGKEEMYESINHYMPEEARPIPFENMLYIGDGLTDVPSMTVLRKNGGYSIAVYDQAKKNGLSICKELLQVGRFDFIAEANYQEGSELDKLVKLLIDNMYESIRYGREQLNQFIKYSLEEF